MLEGYAEYYSAELSEKIHRGQRENALKGRNNGGGIPLGYSLGEEQKLVINPLVAPIVREIFTRYADGETARSLVEDFNGRELKTKKGTPFKINHGEVAEQSAGRYSAGPTQPLHQREARHAVPPCFSAYLITR